MPAAARTRGRHVQRLGREQHERACPSRPAEAAHGQHDHDYPQQAVPAQPAQPGGYPLGEPGCAAPCLSVPGGTRQSGQQRRRSRERRDVHGERRDRGQREQRAPDGWAEERAADHLHDVLGAVRPGQQVRSEPATARPTGPRCRRPPARCRGRGQPDERPDADVVDRDQDGDRGDSGTLDKLSRATSASPVTPVNERAGLERDHQPGQVVAAETAEISTGSR